MDINEVRDRLSLHLFFTEDGSTAEVMEEDLRALLADHARLQADAHRLDGLEGFVRNAYVYGVSFDYAKSCEGEPGGFRFMTRHRLDCRHPSLRCAIDAAEVQP